MTAQPDKKNSLDPLSFFSLGNGIVSASHVGMWGRKERLCIGAQSAYREDYIVLYGLEIFNLWLFTKLNLKLFQVSEP